MNLHEYQARGLLAARGVPITEGIVCATAEEARDAAERIGGPVVVKAQVLTGGRGKAGGVKLAADPAEAHRAAQAILGMSIRDLVVHRVLVVPAIDIKREIYLGCILDRAQCCLTIMASADGGMDIEDVAARTPERILRMTADPFLGIADYQARDLGFQLGFEVGMIRRFVPIVNGLFRTVLETDASLCEINPLVIDASDQFIALDAKLTVDDNALYRHPELEAMRDLEAEDPFERQARSEGINFVRLDGAVGCIVNGAGLAMATMDAVKLAGSSPANFMDVAGGARSERVAAALRIILSDPNVRSILINIFGGITRCDEVARGILRARDEVDVSVPMVVRLVGTNEADGRALLAAAGIEAQTTMSAAAEAAVRLASRP
ncbi:MAG: ADP-forming succinate--CoA ligase subunit beta [Chloroflexi bacterium]|nr:ADP-forming succinate--CoA ligase subunit beta [Chloroflexota bacterium]